MTISLNSIESELLDFRKTQKVLYGHSNTIDSLIKQNANEIATGSYDSTIRYC